MSFLDKAKDLVETAHEKLAPEAVGKAADVAAQGVETVAEKVDGATDGKYHDRIKGASEKVADALRGLGGKS